MTIDANQNKHSLITCLIVDDEQDIRESLQRKFERRGFKVFTAEDGQAAFDRCKTTPIDVIVTDIRMPRMTGIELLEAVKVTFKEQCPTVICMSAYSDVTLEGAYHRGADALFPKPIDTKALIAAIDHFYEARIQRLSRWKSAV